MLDVLARTPLWEIGLEYLHGTGHGVGAFLNVHEGIFIHILFRYRCQRFLILRRCFHLNYFHARAHAEENRNDAKLTNLMIPDFEVQFFLFSCARENSLNGNPA